MSSILFLLVNTTLTAAALLPYRTLISVHLHSTMVTDCPSESVLIISWILQSLTKVLPVSACHNRCRTYVHISDAFADSQTLRALCITTAVQEGAETGSRSQPTKRYSRMVRRLELSSHSHLLCMRFVLNSQ